MLAGAAAVVMLINPQEQEELVVAVLAAYPQTQREVRGRRIAVAVVVAAEIAQWVKLAAQAAQES